MTNANTTVKIVECPRDAWQGLPQQIPTEEKVAYHLALAEAGFRHLDAVSFVSPKLVPQMADSEAVLEGLCRAEAFAQVRPEIIAIVVNRKGLERALAAPGVTTLGYPHSTSSSFLRRNQNISLEESREFVEVLLEASQAAGKSLVVYLSVAFGNPYGEPWWPGRVAEEARWLERTGVGTISLADTVGRAHPQIVARVIDAVRRAAPDLELGVHLHSRPEGAEAKVVAAYTAGIERFDGALTGLGGCPFAGDELVGNIPTEIVVKALADRGAVTGIRPESLKHVLELAARIRDRYNRPE